MRLKIIKCESEKCLNIALFDIQLANKKIRNILHYWKHTIALLKFAWPQYVWINSKNICLHIALFATTLSKIILLVYQHFYSVFRVSFQFQHTNACILPNNCLPEFNVYANPQTNTQLITVNLNISDSKLYLLKY